MNADIGSVLREYREKENISVKQVSSYLTSKGFRASEKTIYSWEKGGSQPSPDAFLLLCKMYNISNILDTFGYVKDKKSGFNLSIDETVHIKKYRQLDDYSKTVVDSVIDLALKRLPVEEKEDNIIRLPFSANKASAGTGYFLFDAYPDSTIDITLNKTTERANECIAVSGNSMEPMFYDGDILLVKRQANIDEGQIGIFVKDGQGYVKKKGFDRLISLNPEYDDILPSEYDDINCYGLVLGKVNKEWIK